jgi:hypothetical protein
VVAPGTLCPPSCDRSASAWLGVGTVEGHMADNEDDDMTVVPFPGEDNEAERLRIRKSNDRDQEMERRGEQSRHNRGYDEAADGIAAPEIERVVDE